MKKKIIAVITAIVLIIITIVATYGIKVIEKYSYSKERADLFEYFNISENETAIMLQDEILEQKAKIIDDVAYLEFKLVQEYFNDRFYFDVNEGYLLYTGFRKQKQSRILWVRTVIVQRLKQLKRSIRYPF